MDLFTNLFQTILIFLYSTFGNLGVAIIVFTILIRLVLLPLTLPSIKSSKKIQELQPELKKLKAQHKGDKQALALAQAALYKSYNINPLAGCLPQLVQLFILIVLYQSIIGLFNEQNGQYNLNFFWVDLSQFDPTYILPVVAGITQFLLSLMILPVTQTRDLVPNDSKSKTVQDANRKEEDIAEMAVTMQQQMVFLMPVMTVFIALKLPSGLALYWVAGTLITMATQYFVSGWGGLATYWNRYVAAAGPLKGKFLAESTTKELTLIPKKINIKKTSLFSKAADTNPLAGALQGLGGSKTALKPKNKRATKPKKKNKNKR
jgi:YidC/Oxa1 family membrane protein insertase